jgi:hypothetical protein
MWKEVIHFGFATGRDVNLATAVKAFTLLVAVQRASCTGHGFSAVGAIKGKQHALLSIVFDIYQMRCHAHCPSRFNQIPPRLDLDP